MGRGLRATLVLGLFLLSVAGSPDVFASPKVIYARTAVGEIYKIYPEKRMAIISGYLYYFGDSLDGDASEITLYGYKKGTGAFELLTVGMKVWLRYAQDDTGRYVLRLKQLSPNTNIYARGVKRDP